LGGQKQTHDLVDELAQTQPYDIHRFRIQYVDNLLLSEENKSLYDMFNISSIGVIERVV